MKIKWMFVVITLLLVSVITPSLSFPTGAPQASCQTLAPDAMQHGAPPQVTDVPYILNLSAFYVQTAGEISMVYTPDTIYNRKAQWCNSHDAIIFHAVV